MYEYWYENSAYLYEYECECMFEYEYANENYIDNEYKLENE